MTGTVVQHAEIGFTAASGAATVAHPTAGNLLIAWSNADITMTTPTDDGSNTGWTAGPSVVDGNGVYIWYRNATSTDASSLTSVTFHANSSTSPVTSGVLEVSGLITSSFDKQGSATAAASPGTSTPTLTAITTTGADGDFVFAIAGLHALSGTPTSPSWTNSFTNIALSPQSQGSGASGVATFIATLVQVPSGSITTQCSWTNGATDRQILIISFKLAAAAGDVTGPVYGVTATDRADGTGSWVNVTNAQGAPNGSSATWTAP